MVTATKSPTWKMRKTQQQNHPARRWTIGLARQRDSRRAACLWSASISSFLLQTQAQSEREAPQATSVTRCLTFEACLRGHVQCCGDTQRWSDTYGTSPGPGLGQPDAIARELKYRGSCYARYTNRIEISGLHTGWSARKGRWRNSQGWTGSLRPCFPLPPRLYWSSNWYNCQSRSRECRQGCWLVVTLQQVVDGEGTSCCELK